LYYVLLSSSYDEVLQQQHPKMYFITLCGIHNIVEVFIFNQPALG
jgi:hypothetical protein